MSALREKQQSGEPSPEVVAPQVSPAGRALQSLLIPGLGQFAQRRFLIGAGQLVTVLAYSATALSLGGPRALLLSIAFNVWSAIDAYRHERNS